jgi:adenylate cyclase class 2
MSFSDKELEVKFYLPDLQALEARLKALGAWLVQPRVLETNLRFDTADDSLRRSYRVLRLRQDIDAHVTYKGPGTVQDGVRVRQEYEFIVSDFSAAKALFEALGYQVSLMYEKYRAVYTLEMPPDLKPPPLLSTSQVLVTLDEMPYGNFMEIEGPDGTSIRAAAEILGLDWDERILDSYIALFDRLRAHMGLTFRDLSFANFKGIRVPAEALGVQ